MRDGRGTLGKCLAKAEEEGEAGSDKSLYGLDKRTQESSDPSDVLSWVDQPAFNVNGNSPNELSVEMKNDLSEAPDLQESLRRNSALAAALSKTMALSFARTEGRGVKVLPDVGEALVRDWLRRGPRATDRRRNWCRKGEPGVWSARLQPLELPRYHELNLLQLGTGILEDESPSAFLGIISELEPPSLYSILSATLYACPDVPLNNETKNASLDCLKPVFSEQTIEYKEMLSSVQSIPSDLQVTLGLLAL
ncbi:protein FAM220A [Elephas maximus indicus]|uniref:protein FAM220A n=1 Tax=Elephas maximus indicus TaxID=99487 RepID=UPI0021163ABA|nr:protein FAM220A [Elephas maximus indicus]